MSGARAVGKIAGEPDFIGGGSPLDSWLYEAVTEALDRWGSAWPSTLRTGPTYGFLWEDQCGVLAPSRDALGRDYPLAIFFEAPRGPRRALWLAGAEFLEGAGSVVAEARVRKMDYRDLMNKVRSLRPPGEKEVADADHAYQAWLHSTAIGGWGPILASRQGPAVSICRGELLMRLAVPRGGAPGIAPGVALWLDVIARIAQEPRSAFWNAAQGTLTICPGVPVSLVGALWPSKALAWREGHLADIPVPPQGTLGDFLEGIEAT